MDRNGIIKETCKILKEASQLEIKPDNLDCDLKDSYGIDSLKIVDILIQIEAHFDIEIDSNLLTYESFSTLGRLVEYIEAQISQSSMTK
jgi:acyl carrier protein